MVDLARLTTRWTSRDGVTLTIRPIVPDDEARETAFVASLSAENAYQRMMSARVPSATQIERWTHIDYDHEMALVAIDADDRLCGVTRYVRDDAGGAEFAIVLADDWHRRGLGHALMQALIAIAREAGIGTLWGITLSTNVSMLALARNLGFHLAREDGDATVTRMTLSLAPDGGTTA